MTVGYAAPGLDATVAAGYIDYKVVNTYDFPIYIQGYLSGNKVVFNIYGNKEAMGGKTYQLVNEILETYDYKTEEVKDPTLEEGVKVVEDKIVSFDGNEHLESITTTNDTYEIYGCFIAEGAQSSFTFAKHLGLGLDSYQL